VLPQSILVVCGFRIYVQSFSSFTVQSIVHLQPTGHRHFKINLDLEMNPTLKVVSDGFLSVPHVPRSTDTESTWEQAREWIHWSTRTTLDPNEGLSHRLCTQIHTDCHREMMEGWLPTRLIHVSDKDEDLRLCMTEDTEHSRISDARFKYVTLTYCWGTANLSFSIKLSTRCFATSQWHC
jgi:hypothetical protein